MLHKTFVAVDEASTEAAAATAVITKLRGMPAAPIEVTVEMDAPETDKGGCSTTGQQTPPSLAWMAGLIGLVGLRRRRAA